MHEEGNSKDFGVALAELADPQAAQRFQTEHHNDINSSALLDSRLPAKTRQFPLYLPTDPCRRRGGASQIERLGFPTPLKIVPPIQNNRAVG